MIRDLYQLRQQRLATKADVVEEYTATITEYNGSIWNDESKRLNWVQRADGTGQLTAAYNKSTASLSGMVVRVRVMKDSEYPVIVDIPPEFYAVSPSALLPNHHLDHEPGGIDMLWLYTKLIVPLAAYPGAGLTVSVIKGYYSYNGTRKEFSGQIGKDLSASQPASGLRRYVGLYLNSSNALQTVNGSTVASGVTPPEPTWPAGSLPLSVVDLDGDATAIAFSNIHDRRPWLTLDVSNSYTAGSGLSLTGNDFAVDITELTEDTTPDGAADYVMTYDASASGNKKVLLENLPGGGGGLNHTYIGYNAAGGSRVVMTGGRAYMKKVTISTAGVLTSIGCYITHVSPVNVQSLAAWVMSDDAGTPDLQIALGAKMPAASFFNADEPRWIDMPVGVYLTAGDYWLCVQRPADAGSDLYIYYDGSGSDKYQAIGGAWSADGSQYTITDTTDKYSIRGSLIY